MRDSNPKRAGGGFGLSNIGEAVLQPESNKAFGTANPSCATARRSWVFLPYSPPNQVPLMGVSLETHSMGFIAQRSGGIPRKVADR